MYHPTEQDVSVEPTRANHRKTLREHLFGITLFVLIQVFQWSRSISVSCKSICTVISESAEAATYTLIKNLCGCNGLYLNINIVWKSGSLNAGSCWLRAGKQLLDRVKFAPHPEYKSDDTFPYTSFIAAKSSIFFR